MSLRHKIAPLNCKLETVISSLKNAYLIQSEGNIFLSRVPIADGRGGGAKKYGQKATPVSWFVELTAYSTYEGC